MSLVPKQYTSIKAHNKLTRHIDKQQLAQFLFMKKNNLFPYRVCMKT